MSATPSNTGHAAPWLQPSSFKRTINCPGWRRTTAGLPKEPPKIFAAEGSVAHEIGARCLLKDMTPWDFVGQVGWYRKEDQTVGFRPSPARHIHTEKYFRFDIDEKMADAVDTYVKECRRVAVSLINPKILVEHKMDLGWLVEGMFGTGDFVAIEPLRNLVVVDYKHGAGVSVEIGEKVGDNPQLSIYGLGALGKDNDSMVESVTVIIVQPRCPHPMGPIRSVTFPADELLQWGYDVVVPAVERCMKEDAPVKAGEWCKFCPAENAMDAMGAFVCPARATAQHDAAVAMFGQPITPESTDIIVPPDPKTLSGEKLGKYLEFFETVFTPWAKAVEEEAYRRLEDGSPDAPTNRKLVAGRQSDRKWFDESLIYPELKTILPRGDVYQEKLATPAQIETKLKRHGKTAKEAKEIIDKLIAERTTGKASMVSIDDSRPALPPKAQQMFGEES